MTEVAALEVLVGLEDLGAAVHHERAGPGQRLAELAAGLHPEREVALVGDGHTVLLGAADTFRAAAADQLQTWGERVGAKTVRADRDGRVAPGARRC